MTRTIRSHYRLDDYVNPATVRYDNAGFGAFLRQLEDIEEQVNRDEWPEYAAAAGKVLPLDIRNRPWAKKTTYYRQTYIGRFKLFRSYGTTIPMINVLQQEFTQDVFTWAGGYQFTDDDIEAAQHTGFPIETEMIQGVREAAEQTLDELILFGSREENMPGFFNHPEFLYSYSPFPFDSTAPSPQAILSVMNSVPSSTAALTKQVEKPSRLLVPGLIYDYLASTKLSDVGARTIMEHYLATSRFIKSKDDVMVMHQLESAGPNGEPLMIWFDPNPRKVKAIIMQELTWKPFQRQNMSYQRVSQFKYAGIRAYRPWSVHILVLPLPL